MTTVAAYGDEFSARLGDRCRINRVVLEQVLLGSDRCPPLIYAEKAELRGLDAYGSYDRRAQATTDGVILDDDRTFKPG